MKTKIVVEVLKADNCWNAYSPSVVGCMATGQTPEQAIEKFRAIAGNAIRAALDDARLIEVDVPDVLPDEKVRKPQIHEVSRWRMTKTDMIEWLRERAGGCAVQEWGPKYLAIADLLESGEIVKGLPELPEGCEHVELRGRTFGDMRYDYNPVDGARWVSCATACDALELVACKPELCGTDYLDKMEPGPFMWKGKMYFLRYVAGYPTVYTPQGFGPQLPRKGGEWVGVNEIFGTSDISDLNAKTVQRVKEWT